VKTKFTLKIINREDDLNTFKVLINSDNPIPNSWFCFFLNIWTNQTNNAHWQRLRKHKINHVTKASLQPFLYSGALPKLFPNNYSSIQTQLLTSPNLYLVCQPLHLKNTVGDAQYVGVSQEGQEAISLQR
jgi:hypothetical protein